MLEKIEKIFKEEKVLSIEDLKEKCLRLDIDLRHFLFSMMYQ